MTNESLEKSPETTPFREWLEKELPAQFREQIDLLNRIGLLEILSDGDPGIVGIDGKEYSLPSLDDIKREILEKEDIVMTKQAQGFTKLQITPIALPLERFIQVFQERLSKYSKNGSLVERIKKTKEEHYIISSYAATPFKAVKELIDSDTEDRLMYTTKIIGDWIHGENKEKFIKNNTLNGFRIVFYEERVTTPIRGFAGPPIGGRKALEAGDTPLDYLKEISAKGSSYSHEKGQTPEDWLTHSIIHLEKTQQEIINYSRGVYLAGTYLGGENEKGTQVKFPVGGADLYFQESFQESPDHGINTLVSIS